MVIFVSSFKGVSKKGNDFQSVTLMEVKNSQKENKVAGRVVDFFVNNVDCSNLECGDVVKAEFQESELLGGKPELVSVEKMGENVFAELL